MTIYKIFITLFWATFVIYWLVAAVSSKRTINRRVNWGRGLVWRLVAVVVIVALFSSPAGAWILSFNTYLTNPVWQTIGVILCGCGIGLAIWARRYLGTNWGMPMSIKAEPELVTTGPYSTVRHPIYSGMLLAMLGTILVQNSTWIIVLIFAGAYFIYSAYKEEKIMASTFPNQYPAYKQRTKMLVPFVF